MPSRGRKVRRCLIAIATVLLASSSAHAAVLATCGGSKGYTYFIEGNLVAPGEAGWSEDGITGGMIMLVSDGADIDLMIGDTVGTRSAKSDGAKVFLTGSSADQLVVVAAYPLSLEVYQFDLTHKIVLWSQAKFGTPIAKAALFKADCN